MTNWVPGAFYFARSGKHSNGNTTVVQVSTVFGKDPEYWTVVAIGSDQHYMIGDFDLFVAHRISGGVSSPAGCRIASN
ncbi:hypothetical protein [Rhizobium sp. BK376]|uniref:hypothetical protein n=1 Tax=Rhizobium/Agrobacterium group TaxID=227290 RepID=UPI0010EF83C6|nr:hypothetical protein EV561_16510 [Rhizobium sp. BK376]